MPECQITEQAAKQVKAGVGNNDCKIYVPVEQIIEAGKCNCIGHQKWIDLLIRNNVWLQTTEKQFLCCIVMNTSIRQIVLADIIHSGKQRIGAGENGKNNNTSQ